MPPSEPTMLELILLHVEPPAELRAQAVHDTTDPESPWVILIAPKVEDYWLVWLETDDLRAFHGGLSFDPDACNLLERMALLFGDPWDALWEDWQGLIETQRQILDQVTDSFLAGMERAPLEELIEWRKTMDKAPPTAGELIVERMVGTKPIQNRN